MKTLDPKHQIRWRLSKEVTADLTHTRRQIGCRSWDEFYRALLARWNERSESRAPVVLPQLEYIHQKFDKFSPQILAIHGLLETQEQTLQSIMTEQAQTSELIRRFNALLALVLGMNPDLLDEQQKIQVPSFSPREKILNKIKRKNVQP